MVKLPHAHIAWVTYDQCVCTSFMVYVRTCAAAIGDITQYRRDGDQQAIQVYVSMNLQQPLYDSRTTMYTFHISCSVGGEEKLHNDWLTHRTKRGETFTRRNPQTAAKLREGIGGIVVHHTRRSTAKRSHQRHPSYSSSIYEVYQGEIKLIKPASLHLEPPNIEENLLSSPRPSPTHAPVEVPQ